MRLTTGLPLLFALGARVFINTLLPDPTHTSSTPDFLLNGLFQGVLIHNTLTQIPQIVVVAVVGVAAKLVIDFVRLADVIQTACTVLGVALGVLFTEGYARSFVTEIVVGIVGTVVLAVVFDLILVGAAALLMPWTRRATVRKGGGRRRASHRITTTALATAPDLGVEEGRRSPPPSSTGSPTPPTGRAPTGCPPPASEVHPAADQKKWPPHTPARRPLLLVRREAGVRGRRREAAGQRIPKSTADETSPDSLSLH